ncbi:MAG TPA: hypothetical protein VGO93_26110 [Candidatus Xenobia bacterium]
MAIAALAGVVGDLGGAGLAGGLGEAAEGGLAEGAEGAAEGGLEGGAEDSLDMSPLAMQLMGGGGGVSCSAAGLQTPGLQQPFQTPFSQGQQNASSDADDFTGAGGSDSDSGDGSDDTTSTGS